MEVEMEMEMEMGDERVVSCFESLSVPGCLWFWSLFYLGSCGSVYGEGACARVCLRLLACFVKMHKSPTFIFRFSLLF